MNKEQFREKIQEYGSVCDCGHIGDKENSDHDTRFQAGHGACKIDGCDCQQFTWVK